MTSARRWAVRGGVGVLVVGSVAGAGWFIGAAGAGAGSSRAAGRSSQVSAAASSPSTTSPSSGPSPNRAAGGGWRTGPSSGRFGGIGGGGSITAITSDSVTVKSSSGTRTILTTSQTVYVEAMSLVARSALKVGENVAVSVKPELPPAGSFPNWPRPGAPASGSSGTGSTTTSSATTPEPTAEAIEIVVPELAGRVASVSTAKIVVEGRSGLQQTIVTSSSTSYRELGVTVSVSAVTAGETVVGFGSVAADHSELDASTVAVVGPLAGGKVTGVSGSTITVQSPRGTVRISTSGSTIFRTNAGSSSLAGVKSGDLVLAVGLQAGTSGFTASGLWFGTASGPTAALRIAFGTGPALGAIAGLGGTFGAGGPHGFGGSAGGFGGSAGGFGGFGHSAGFAPGAGTPAAANGSGSGSTTT